MVQITCKRCGKKFDVEHFNSVQARKGSGFWCPKCQLSYALDKQAPMP